MSSSDTFIRRLPIPKDIEDSDATPLELNKQITVLYADLTEFMELGGDLVDDPRSTPAALAANRRRDCRVWRHD